MELKVEIIYCEEFEQMSELTLTQSFLTKITMIYLSKERVSSYFNFKQNRLQSEESYYTQTSKQKGIKQYYKCQLSKKTQ